MSNQIKIFTLFLCFTFILSNKSFAQKNSKEWFALGLEHLKQKEYIDAISDFTSVVGLENNNSEAYYQRAVAKLRLSANMGYESTELCFDLKTALDLGYINSISYLDKYCTRECYDINKAHYEPELVLCADFSSKILSKMPIESKEMVNLTKLVLFNNKFEHLPVECKSFNGLLHLDLSSNRLLDMNNGLQEMKYLLDINLNKNQIKEVPDEIGKLEFLKYLYLRSNEICLISKEIGKCKNLEVLDLSLNSITDLPKEILLLKNLKILNLVGNALSPKWKKDLYIALPNTQIFMD